MVNTRNFLFWGGVALIVIAGAIFFRSSSTQTPSSMESEFPGYQTGSLEVRNVRLNIVFAKTDLERMQGLGDRPTLSEDTGMFFVFPVSDTYGFWMRHMQFPIDMIWIVENFRIVHIEKSVTPDSFPETFTPDAPARFVLETSAGFAKKNGILIGDIAHVSDF